MSLLTHLECSATGETYDADRLQNLSTAGKPLLARYDLDKAAGLFTPAKLKSSPEPGLWRYASLLPVRDSANVAYLGEGWTPLQRTEALGKLLGLSQLYVKDESPNPTGSFKARGMATAVARAKELGATDLAVGTAGNAGSALAAYAAALGIKAHIAMPVDAPYSNQAECEAFGAELTLVNGLITDANARVQEGVRELGWFDVATLREPYRLEGKKTMGYELFEQFEGELPEVIIYPTGGGTGLIGMWKAFDEMEKMGWIGSGRPRMVSVQAAGCAPIVRAYERGETFAEPWANAETWAGGLRVPRAIGDFLILKAVRDSCGTAVAVTEAEIGAAWAEFSALTGIFPAPEGAAAYAALKLLVDRNWVEKDERVVVFNTGTGVKYLESWRALSGMAT